MVALIYFIYNFYQCHSKKQGLYDELIDEIGDTDIESA